MTVSRAPIPLSLYDFLRIGHIKRWHNVNTIREQTVAEHSYLVTIIALDLYASVAGVPAEPVPMMPAIEEYVCMVRDLLKLLIGAIFHDAPEAASGDTPTPAKRLLRQISGDPALFQKVDDFLMPQLPYILEKMPIHLEKFVKMADAIEGCHWISENGAGTHAKVVQAAGRRRMEDLVEKYDTEDTRGADWYRAVNKVLMALGMPYVHKESRISPP